MFEEFPGMLDRELDKELAERLDEVNFHAKYLFTRMLNTHNTMKTSLKKLAKSITLSIVAVSYLPGIAQSQIVIADFEDYAGAPDSTVLFRFPGFSGDNIDVDPFEEDIAVVRDINSVRVPEAARGNPEVGQQVMHLSWTFEANWGEQDPGLRYVRVRTVPLAPSDITDPIISFEHPFRFDIFTDEPIEITLLVRETNSEGAIGENGGRSGDVKWLGSSGERVGNAISSGILVPAGEWITLVFDIPELADSAIARTGEGGPLTSTTGKGVFEALGFVGEPGVTYNVFLDNFVVEMEPTNGNGNGEDDGKLLGYDIGEDGWVDTGDFFGRLYAEQEPWIYSQLLQGWVYIDDENHDEEHNGAWVYILK